MLGAAASQKTALRVAAGAGRKTPQEDQGLSPTFKARCPGSQGWESGQKYKLHKYAILEEEEYEVQRGPGCGRGSNHG